MDVFGVVITCITCQVLLDQLAGVLSPGAAAAAVVL